MLQYFNDSSDRGKLYINYPMMQSYKHLKKMPDDDFKDRKIKISILTQYKEIVGRESKYTDLKKYKYPVFMSIIAHHIKKANFILSDKYTIPIVKEFIDWDYTKIYDQQLDLLKKEGQVYVLNTFLFNIIEYKPNQLLNQLINKEEMFLL